MDTEEVTHQETKFVTYDLICDLTLKVKFKLTWGFGQGLTIVAKGK